MCLSGDAATVARKKGEWVASINKDGEEKEQRSESEMVVSGMPDQPLTKKRKHKDGKVVYTCVVMKSSTVDSP